jgi:hypothetical protein
VHRRRNQIISFVGRCWRLNVSFRKAAQADLCLLAIHLVDDGNGRMALACPPLGDPGVILVQGLSEALRFSDLGIGYDCIAVLCKISGAGG